MNTDVQVFWSGAACLCWLCSTKRGTEQFLSGLLPTCNKSHELPVSRACCCPQGMKGVADRAGGMIGGHMGFAMQAHVCLTVF